MARQANSMVKGHPAHQARMDKGLGATSHLPDPLIRLMPVQSQPAKQTTQVLPEIIGNVLVAIIDVDSVHQLAIDVKLLLVVRTIANTHGMAPQVSFQVVKSMFREGMTAINAVYRLKSTILLYLMTTSVQLSHKGPCLLGEPHY